jgi:AraC family transcriptional regulator
MTGSEAYLERFAKVIDYIDAHLDEDLSVERLSQVASFSKFHFHRQFSNYAGITVSRYIQMQRLKRASHRLVFDVEARIIDVALEAGFETPESFARAFKRDYGQTPSEFRVSPAWKPWGERYQFPASERRRTMDVKIVDFQATKVAALEHRGAPELLNDSVAKFIAWRKESKLSPVKISRTFGIALTIRTASPLKHSASISAAK